MKRRLHHLIATLPPRLSWASLALAVAALVISDVGSEIAGGSTFPGGPLDETAHLLTTLLLLWALGRLPRRMMIAALIASVAIEVDHIPGRLGADWLTAGTPRPYTHSLLMIALPLAASLIWPRARAVGLGIALGLAGHFFRDMTQSASSISLMWPLSDRGFSLPHWVYICVMALIVGVDALRCRRQAIGAREAAARLARNRPRTGAASQSLQADDHNGARTFAKPRA